MDEIAVNGMVLTDGSGTKAMEEKRQKWIKKNDDLVDYLMDHPEVEVELRKVFRLE